MAIQYVMAGAGLVKGIMDAYGQEQQRKAQRRALKGQLGALENLANVTPSERDYVARRRRIMAEGDPMINEEFNRSTGTIRQQGAFNRQRAQGQAIQQGLEGSIVAQELRRKVDKDVLDSVANQARQMALANRQAKRVAEGEMEQMNLRTDARKQDVAYKKAVVQSQLDAMPGYSSGMAWGQAALGTLQGYASAYKSTGSDWELIG